MKCIYRFLVLLLGVDACFAQQIPYTRALVTGDFVTIYYTLESSRPGQEFYVELYHSYDQYQKPLQHVRGDVGSRIPAGEMRKIEWGIQKEMDAYQGEMAFEVRARLVYSPVVITFPQSLTQLKCGETYDIRWEGGSTDKPVQLTLFQEGGQGIPLAVVSNSGHYRWEISRKIRQADNYRLEISEPGKNVRHRTISGKFAIRRRVPKQTRTP